MRDRSWCPSKKRTGSYSGGVIKPGRKRWGQAPAPRRDTVPDPRNGFPEPGAAPAPGISWSKARAAGPVNAHWAAPGNHSPWGDWPADVIVAGRGVVADDNR